MEGYSGLSLAGSPQGESQDKASENLSDSKNLSNQNKDFNAVFKKKKNSMTHKISKIYFK